MKKKNKKKILIIDDDSEMRSLLKDFLGEEGFDVVPVSTGSDALRLLGRESFDLVITDIRMPGLTGLDILPGIKRVQPKVAVLVITAFGSEDIYQKALEKGAVAYLEKPICFNALGATVQQLIGKKQEDDQGR